MARLPWQRMKKLRRCVVRVIKGMAWSLAVAVSFNRAVMVTRFCTRARVGAYGSYRPHQFTTGLASQYTFDGLCEC